MPCSNKQPKPCRTSNSQQPRHCNEEAARYYVSRERKNLESRTKSKNSLIFTALKASSICARTSMRTSSECGKSSFPKTTLASSEFYTGLQSLISRDSSMTERNLRCEGCCP